MDEAFKQLIELAKENGLWGLLIVAVAWLLAKSVKPVSDAVVADRKNARLHDKEMHKLQEQIENRRNRQISKAVAPRSGSSVNRGKGDTK